MEEDQLEGAAYCYAALEVLARTRVVDETWEQVPELQKGADERQQAEAHELR